MMALVSLQILGTCSASLCPLGLGSPSPSWDQHAAVTTVGEHSQTTTAMAHLESQPVGSSTFPG